jgi:predicted Zn-dependent protease
MRSVLVPTALVATLALGVGCSSRPVVAAEKAAAAILISPEQENQLGAQLHAQLQKEGMKFLEDPEVTRYIDDMIRPILQAAKRDRPELKWRIHVVDDPAVNAFATPGGYIYVQKGLILASQTESELAGVLAHEAGHVTGRHGARNLVQAYGLQTVAALALGENPGQLAQLAAQILATGAMLKHSRVQEIEADEYGARYSSAAGYDPRGLIAFFQTLQKQSGDTPRPLTWLSTHPAHSERISHLQAYIKKHNLRAGQANPLGRLSQIQQRLGGATTTR